ncbi:MAG: methyltransferase domain-containing protein, partial [Candidatus Omnitrophica bacterium]|nr:methyltransferase domain-containing protein [Candidatus Omnitrophota bacterium]
MLELITDCAAAILPEQGSHVLDVGCGAGNFSLRLFLKREYTALTLLDLSRPMLDRAEARLKEAGLGQTNTCQADIRDTDFPEETFDTILAAAVLHHLRGEEEWENVFKKMFSWLKPGGAVWIFDLITHDHPKVHEVLWERYRDYLRNLGGIEYIDEVFRYISAEDSPR